MFGLMVTVLSASVTALRIPAIRTLMALIFLSCIVSSAAARELVHAYPLNGLPEVAGATPANRVLRAMQRYAVPAFTDTLARHVAHTLQAESDAPVTLTRRLGQGGKAAAMIVSAAPADGSKLLLASTFPVQRTAANGKRGSDLRPIALVATMPYVLVVTPQSSIADVSNLFGPTRGSRIRTLIASAGGTSASHRLLEQLRLKVAPSTEPVAYNGGGAALQAILVSEAHAAVVPLPVLASHTAGGAGVRVLAIADSRRHPLIPDIPTLAEAGLAPFTAVGWFAVFAPAATPAAVFRDLDMLLSRGVGLPAPRDLFTGYGLRLEHLGADAFLHRYTQD
jgi:tripartite-type tricarboxylate transporter receptor subunit TctC